MTLMKTKFFTTLLGLAVLARDAGYCGRPEDAGVPFVHDKIEARYERPMDEVFQAAKDVIKYKRGSGQ